MSEGLEMFGAIEVQPSMADGALFVCVYLVCGCGKPDCGFPKGGRLVGAVDSDVAEACPSVVKAMTDAVLKLVHTKRPDTISLERTADGDG